MLNPIRVVQWATGRIGVMSLKVLLTSKEFEVVGCFVHNEQKHGEDVGHLAGMLPVGVSATTNIEDILALQPDCVVAAQEGACVDDMCRFLAAGINIVTSRVDYLEPSTMDAMVRLRIEAACKKGQSAIHATGSSPGFSSEILPLVALAMARDMDRLVIEEFADIPASCPDVQVVEGMGFGRQSGGEFNQALLDHMAHGFIQSLSVIANKLGLSVQRFDVRGEIANANNAFLLPGGTPISKGTVAAQQIIIAAIVADKPLLEYRIFWYCSKDIDRDWVLQDSGWRVCIEGGTTPMDISVSFPKDLPNRSESMAALTAYRLVNAVPYICQASAGIKTSSQLPAMVANMGLLAK
jgi:hypothetical protein